MNKNNQMIGAKIDVIVIDPWITPYQFTGKILNVSKDFENNYVVAKLDEPLILNNQKCEYFRLIPHNYSKIKIEELMTRKNVDCEMIRISESDANIIDTEYMSVWKRDVAVTATVIVKDE